MKTLNFDTPPWMHLQRALLNAKTKNADLAKKLGTSPSNVSLMISGNKPIGLKVAKALEQALGIDYRLLMTDNYL